MEFEIKTYGKSELALLYFPDCDPDTALKRLNRWINNIRELKAALADFHVGKNAKYWTKNQVYLITYYIGEP